MNFKSILSTGLVVLLFPNLSTAQFNLEIEISGVKSDKGKIMLQILDEKQEVLKQLMGAIQDKKCLFSNENLKPGKYAVRYFHDENLSGSMDTNLFGKPTEGYGFSNNVTGKFGAPPFEKWLFDIKSDTKISLKPTY
jgi:uncharacterized protein (DUF2141 family)